jgi:hypothetical protein
MALRPPPVVVPEVRDVSPLAVAGGVFAGLLLAAGAAWVLLPPVRDGGDATELPPEVRAGSAAAEAYRRTAHVLSWRAALTSLSSALGDDAARSYRAVRVEADDGGWTIAAEIVVRGDESKVAQAAGDLAPGRAVGRGTVLDSTRLRDDEGVLAVRWRCATLGPPASADPVRLAADLRTLAAEALQGPDAPPAPEEVEHAEVVAAAARAGGDRPPRRLEFVPTRNGFARIERSPEPAAVPADAPPRATDDAPHLGLRTLIPAIRMADPPDEAGPEPAPSVTVHPDGSVRVVAPATWRHRTLERRCAEGDAARGGWTLVAALDGGAVDRIDAVPGASGRWEWRLVGRGVASESAAADVVVDVAVEVLGPAPSGGVRVRLSRPWRGATVSVDADIARGTRVTAESAPSPGEPPVAFATPWVLAAAAVEDRDETVRAELPEFQDDGRVARDADGAPVLAEREVVRSVRVLRVEFRADEGPPRVDFLKMTDG